MDDVLIRNNGKIRMMYVNYRGEASEREITPLGVLEFKATDWHPEPQWILSAYDHDRKERRDFALADCDFLSGKGV